MNMYHGTHEEIREQLVGDISVLPLGGTWELNSGHQAWQHAPLADDPHLPSIIFRLFS